MSDWTPTFCTPSCDPVQCWDENGDELFVIIHLRISGGSDSVIPRRVVGTGRTRDEADASAAQALTTCDSTYRLVSSRLRA